MKQLTPYLNFNGQCREALEFYRHCLGEAQIDIQTFADAPPVEGCPPVKNGDAVMHAEFKSDGLFFMASDGQPGTPMKVGENVHLSIGLDDVDEQSAIFDNLSAGGQVTMALQNTFWNSRFGMVTDKFGVHWMLNVPLG